MLTERKSRFITNNLLQPQCQVVEEISSESHETRRVPDPYIFVYKDGKLKNPNGKIVEESMDKTSYLGSLEKGAVDKIQNWCEENDSGVAVWFSPPYPEKYPVSKIIFSEIIVQNADKVLLNRAVILDNNSVTLMSLANNLSRENKFTNPEELRGNPLFPDQEKFILWLDELKKYTNQIDHIENDTDLVIKTDTYVQLAEVQSSFNLYKRGSLFEFYQKADDKGLIGKEKRSCPWPINTSLNTPYETFLMQSAQIGEKRMLCCTCPSCGKRVEAEIYGGKIHCPKPPGCGASAEWKK